MQKYRLYLKRVAGVQVQPAGRGKAGHSSSLESQQTYTPMLVPQQMGAGRGGGLPITGETIPEQELKVQLQMQQMRNQQAAVGAQPVYVKQEASFPLSFLENWAFSSGIVWDTGGLMLHCYRSLI